MDLMRSVESLILRLMAVGIGVLSALEA